MTDSQIGKGSLGGRRVALVTGASRGIGRGIAVELARAGFDLIINYRTDQRAADEARTTALAAGNRDGARIETFRADISDAAGRDSLLGFARTQFARLDLLVNNAGVGPEVRTDLLEAGEESFDRLIRVNLKGPYFLTQAVARWMIEQLSDVGQASSLSRPSGSEPRSSSDVGQASSLSRPSGSEPRSSSDVGQASSLSQPSGQRLQSLPDAPGGHSSQYKPMIINIGSISAYAASTDRGDYCISKAGLSMMTALFAERLAAHGVNVYEVRPGIIRTDLTAPVTQKYDRLITDGLTPIRRWGTPEDVGRAVAAIASGALPFSTGEVINVDGGFHLRTL